jgi:hypothetical protein
VQPRYTADAEGLLEFLQEEVTRCGIRWQELQNRALIRDQAFGEALDPDHLESLARYEVQTSGATFRIAPILVIGVITPARMQTFTAPSVQFSPFKIDERPA